MVTSKTSGCVGCQADQPLMGRRNPIQHCLPQLWLSAEDVKLMELAPLSLSCAPYKSPRRRTPSSSRRYVMGLLARCWWMP